MIFFKAVVLQILPSKTLEWLANILYGAISDFKRTFTKPSNDKYQGLFIKRALSLKEFTDDYPASATVIKAFEAKMVYTDPVFYPQLELIPLKHFATLQKEVACLDSTILIGESNLLLPIAKPAIYDFMYQWKDPNIKYTDPAIKHLKGNELLVLIEGEIESIKEGIHVAGNFSFNYYHFLYEFMARFSYIHTSNIDSTVPLLIDESFLKITQFNEVLRLLNTDNRHVIPIKKHRAYIVEKLYTTSCPNHIVPNYKDDHKIQSSDTLYDLNTLEYFFQKITKNIQNGEYPKKIFLSRKNASARRSFNEHEVAEYLKTEGFVEIFPEQHSFSEQISIFHNAEIIIGGSGAALSNIIACRAGTHIICLVNDKYEYSYFSTIASFVEANLICVQGKVVKSSKYKTNIHDPFIIEITKLQKVVSDIQEHINNKFYNIKNTTNIA